MPRPSDPNVSAFAIDSDPPVSGFLHRPAVSADYAKAALVLTHGAGSNCQAPLLVAVARAFAATGITVLRCDLPFRQKRSHGPPFSGSGADDREGLKNAVAAIRRLEPDRPFHRVFVGGHSYGGRQATMLAANDPALLDGLLLLSYPLHPPRKPHQLRTAHFSSLRTPALFVHGSRDPFGSVEEMESALKLIPAPTALIPVEGAGHDLSFGRGERNVALDLPREILDAFERFLGTSLRNR
jgi:uncharacterized protein